jgi:BlaI family penicillinase repressor
MMCLNALWQIGEGNVEEVRRVVSQGKPLAYTTVLTLLDRLAKRGAVSRRKEGRGFRYQPTVERSRLRHMALKQFLEYHFDGSVGELKIFLEMTPFDPVTPEERSEDRSEAQPIPLSDAPPLALAQIAGDAGRPPEFMPASKPAPVAEAEPAPVPETEM